MKKIAFYAPIKPPDHPIASGDRLIAANLVSALELSGFDVELASRFISYSKRCDTEILHSRKRDALHEADSIIERFANSPPDLWFTYHPYCKAPDWLGPRVCDAFGIPYITAEACQTGQGKEDGADLWQSWRMEAQSSMSTARLHFCFKPTDRHYLSSLFGDNNLIDLPPFIDTQKSFSLSDISPPTSSGITLLTVAQMRPGKKQKNYEILSSALSSLQSHPWNLIIIGGGPQEEYIRKSFESIDPTRLHWAGQLSESEVLSHMHHSDIFLWPGWHEPIGMVYLEAQLMGLPIIAQRSGGVPLVVADGETGLLVPESSSDDQSPLSQAILRLLTDTNLRKQLGSDGPKRVESQHSLRSASSVLSRELSKLV